MNKSDEIEIMPEMIEAGATEIRYERRDSEIEPARAIARASYEEAKRRDLSAAEQLELFYELSGLSAWLRQSARDTSD